MTPEQKEALGRVRATNAQSGYLDVSTGTYHTEDVTVVLNHISNLEYIVEIVVEDLKDLKTHLMDGDSNQTILKLVNSSLDFLINKE